MSPFLPDDPNVYRTLLESTRAIPWTIDWIRIGVATMVPGSRDDPAGLMAQAGRRLYQAKSAGRSCMQSM